MRRLLLYVAALLATRLLRRFSGRAAPPAREAPRRRGAAQHVFGTLVALATLGSVAGAAVVAFGLYNVSARMGHLPGVSWLLHTTYRNAVDLRAPPPEAAPDLSNPELIALGANHYDAACRVCHSAPGQERTATVLAMVPHPPHITEAVEDWGPGELWWIVHEGVKMSGMPGWPAAREDEVWSVVAFLSRVRGMSAAEYGALISVPDGASDELRYCARCHGAAGVSRNRHVPRVDIQSRDYLATALRAYRSGRRQSGFMEHAATQMPEDHLLEAALYYAEQPPGPILAEPDPEFVPEGRVLAYATAEGSRIPACRACHGPWPEPLSRAFPSLAGQHRRYLEQQLRVWRDGNHGGGPAAELMHAASQGLTDAQIAAVAAYYASLRPAKLNETQDPR